MSRLAFDAHAAVVRRHNEFHNAQPQAAPAAAAGEALVHLEEPLEDALRVARGQTDSVVLHREEDAAVLRARAQRNVLFVAGVFVGIVQQVHDSGHQRIGIRHDGWQVGSDMRLELAAGDVKSFAHRRDRPFGNVGGRDFLEPERVLITFQAGEGKEVVNQPAEPQILLGNELEVFARGLLV